MEATLIMLPQPILVSDEQIKGGDFYFKDSKVLQWVKGTSVTYTHVHPSNYPKPIIAGIEGLPKLDLSLIAKGIGWVDVEKLAESHYRNWYTEYDVGRSYRGFIHGFKTNQSLNEKKYSEEDMIDFAKFYKGWEAMLSQEKWDIIKDTPDNVFKFWLSKRKPKEYLVEVEIEINQCDGCISGHHIIDGIHKAPYPSGSMVCKKHLYDRPKITNNTIKVLKIIK